MKLTYIIFFVGAVYVKFQIPGTWGELKIFINMVKVGRIYIVGIYHFNPIEKLTN